MGRAASAFFDKAAGCWATNAIGAVRTTAKGRMYCLKSYNRALRDRLKARAWVADELPRAVAALQHVGDYTFEALSELYLQEAESRLGPEAYDRANEHIARFGHWPRPVRSLAT